MFSSADLDILLIYVADLAVEIDLDPVAGLALHREGLL